MKMDLHLHWDGSRLILSCMCLCKGSGLRQVLLYRCVRVCAGGLAEIHVLVRSRLLAVLDQHGTEAE